MQINKNMYIDFEYFKEEEKYYKWQKLTEYSSNSFSGNRLELFEYLQAIFDCFPINIPTTEKEPYSNHNDIGLIYTDVRIRFIENCCCENKFVLEGKRLLTQKETQTAKWIEGLQKEERREQYLKLKSEFGEVDV